MTYESRQGEGWSTERGVRALKAIDLGRHFEGGVKPQLPEDFTQLETDTGQGDNNIGKSMGRVGLGSHKLPRPIYSD